jgi:hypothetical protein
MFKNYEFSLFYLCFYCLLIILSEDNLLLNCHNTRNRLNGVPASALAPSEINRRLCVSTFGVPCCDFRYDFRLFVGEFMSYLHYFWCMVVSNTYCVVFLFVFLRLMYPMLPVSLD